MRALLWKDIGRLSFPKPLRKSRPRSPFNSWWPRHPKEEEALSVSRPAVAGTTSHRDTCLYSHRICSGCPQIHQGFLFRIVHERSLCVLFHKTDETHFMGVYGNTSTIRKSTRSLGLSPGPRWFPKQCLACILWWPPIEFNISTFLPKEPKKRTYEQHLCSSRTAATVFYVLSPKSFWQEHL